MFDVVSPFINLIWPILLAIAGFFGLFFYGKKKKQEGRELEAAKHQTEQIAANKREMDRVGRANTARLDAETRAREGKLTDRYTRKE